MKNKIQQLIEEQKLINLEVFELSSELSNIPKKSVSTKEWFDLTEKVLLLEQEYSLRNSFISDLENLL